LVKEGEVGIAEKGVFWVLEVNASKEDQEEGGIVVVVVVVVWL
jgi:hypothetical protein